MIKLPANARQPASVLVVVPETVKGIHVEIKQNALGGMLSSSATDTYASALATLLAVREVPASCFGICMAAQSAIIIQFLIL